jgi:hypothetical protein
MQQNANNSYKTLNEKNIERMHKLENFIYQQVESNCERVSIDWRAETRNLIDWIGKRRTTKKFKSRMVQTVNCKYFWQLLFLISFPIIFDLPQLLLYWTADNYNRERCVDEKNNVINNAARRLISYFLCEAIYEVHL